MDDAAAHSTPTRPPQPHAELPRTSPHFQPPSAADTPRNSALQALHDHVRLLGGSLPVGWRVVFKTRQGGRSAGTSDTYFLAPNGATFRSRAEVARFLGLEASRFQAARRREPAPPRAVPNRVAVPTATARVLSPFFAPAAAHSRDSAGSWVPPPSPFGLLQETLYADPWKVLVACLLLNKTSALCVRRIIWDLFELAGTPEAALAVPEAAIERIVRPLGLARRAGLLRRLSAAYLEAKWTTVSQLPGCGRYAADAHALFCAGTWASLPPPADKELIKYWTYLHETGGRGRGLSRDPPPVALPGLGGE